MAIPALVAGAGLASRGLVSYLAKKKAREAALRAKFRMEDAGGIPNAIQGLATNAVIKGQKFTPGYKTGLGVGGIGALAGSEMYDRVMHPREKAMNKHREGTYMANPMAGISQNPSYDASMTMDGQIQTMMEEMDGMDLSEEAKRQIIQDKLGINYGYLEMDKDLQAGYGGDRFDKEMVRSNTGAGLTANEMKMFMGRPVQTSGYDRGPIRPRYDENGNLIPQRPTMMV